MTGDSELAQEGLGLWRNPKDFYLQAPRTVWYRTLATLCDCISVATGQFYLQRGILSAHLPITTGSISSPIGLGSDSTPVQISLHGEATYLADSAQFLLEYLCRFSSSGAYYVMPSFRGEDHDETHLNQFIHSEVEIIGDLDDVLSLCESYVIFLVENLLNSQSQQIRQLAGTTEHLETLLSKGRTFPRLSFDDAARILGETGGITPQTHSGHQWRALSREGERQLLKLMDSPVWITHWDHFAVPFYQAYSSRGAEKALNADLLMGPGEVVGAGQRHFDGHASRHALEAHRVPEASKYSWYCEMKDSFPLHTSGFGLGVERFLMWVLRHDDIRDLQIVPRLKAVGPIF